MNRRNFITTGLLGALPLPSFDFIMAKPSKNCSYHQGIGELELHIQSRVRGYLRSRGYETPEYDFDNPQLLRGNWPAIPVYRAGFSEPCTFSKYGFRLWGSKDHEELKHLEENFIKKIVKYFEKYDNFGPTMTEKIVFLNISLEHTPPTDTEIQRVDPKFGTHKTYESNFDGKMIVRVEYEWPRHSAVTFHRNGSMRRHDGRWVARPL